MKTYWYLEKMTRQRHIKTFVQKYGIGDKVDECHKVFKAMKDEPNPDRVFNHLPYLGYIYIDVKNPEFRDWWGYTEDTDLIRAKIIKVDRWDYITIAHIDNHHQVVRLHEIRRADTFRVKGNVLIKETD